jgi:DNA invertase Pin-like site-specific DNA recombinase
METAMAKKLTRYVAYYRVSTKRQSLGLEAQKSVVKDFVNGDAIIIDEYVEKESGKNDKRIELNKAIQKAKSEKATLVIAKLDRLSRNVSFVFALRDSGVPFVCVDLPDMNTLTIGIFATMAQHERELIVKRTKEALAEKKKQGFKLGNPENLTDKARINSIVSRKQSAIENDDNRKAIALIRVLREKGLSYQKTADYLNDNGYRSSRGNKFYATSIKQLEKLYS